MFRTQRTGADLTYRRRAAMVAIIALAGLTFAVVPAAAQQTAAVEVVDSSFVPDTATVSEGGTVTWTQTGSLPHTVTADDGSFDSSPDCPSDNSDCMSSGETFSMTFAEPGEYPYYCKIHGGPGGAGMSGVIVVEAAQTGEPTEEPTSEPTGEPAPEDTEEPEDDGATVTGSIAASDQSGDGTSVLVDEVEISGASGFVVVHLDADGSPGPVIGHVAIPEGRSTNVTVPLNEALSEDATVWPMLHVDAGEVGTYEFPGPDVPVQGGDGIVMVPLSFTVSAQAGELAATGLDAGTAALLIGVAIVLALAGAFLLRRNPRDQRA